jgi:hypothetical protein
MRLFQFFVNVLQIFFGFVVVFVLGAILIDGITSYPFVLYLVPMTYLLLAEKEKQKVHKLWIYIAVYSVAVKNSLARKVTKRNEFNKPSEYDNDFFDGYTSVVLNNLNPMPSTSKHESLKIEKLDFEQVPKSTIFSENVFPTVGTGHYYYSIKSEDQLDLTDLPSSEFFAWRSSKKKVEGYFLNSKLSAIAVTIHLFLAYFLTFPNSLKEWQINSLQVLQLMLITLSVYAINAYLRFTERREKESREINQRNKDRDSFRSDMEKWFDRPDYSQEERSALISKAMEQWESSKYRKE